MNDSLFDIPETKSPRLLWMEKHAINTEMVGADEWRAWHLLIGQHQTLTMANEDTEDEAITQLALKLGIKLWNEEGGAV